MASALLIAASLTAGAVPALAQTDASQGLTPPAPPPPPLVLLLDGLGVYVENDYIGVSALARPLQQQGFRTRTDTHMMARTQGLVPDVIIGHSMGGDMALRYARKLLAAGQPAPLIITIDAAPAPPSCPVPRCINIHGPGFADVRGATNIDAWASGARFVSHAQLATAPVVQQLILDRTRSYIAERRAAAAAPASGPGQMAGSAPPPGAPQATSRSTSQPPATRSWTVPGWTLPNLMP